MPNWTTEERRDVFQQYFTAQPAISVKEYAIRYPKEERYVRGIIKGTHYALETLDLAYGLFMNGGYDLAADFGVATEIVRGKDEIRYDEFSANFQRIQLVIQWMDRIRRLNSEIGIGKK